MSVTALLRRRLQSLEARDAYRRRRVSGSPQQPEMLVDGQPLLSFCSNDYLGLANDPRLVEALCRGARRWGVGSGAAHLINGHSAAHHALEEELAEFTGRPRALLFSTGYMANLGLAAALAGRGDSVLEDRLNHASLLDAGLLSRARLLRYAHADAGDLERRLAGCGAGARLVLTDGVFSMDGDQAPLAALASACAAQRALLVVDDAHGIGVLGADGGGCLQAQSIGPEQVPVLMGTLGKALGTAGAFVAAEEEIIEWMIQAARTYVYTTAQPPALAEATRTSLAIAREESWRRQRLGELVARFRREVAGLGLPLLDSQTPIQPLLVGADGDALRLSNALRERGLLVTAIRPPSVPAGRARLRVTLSAGHRDEHLDRLLQALAELRSAWPAPAPPVS